MKTLPTLLLSLACALTACKETPRPFVRPNASGLNSPKFIPTNYTEDARAYVLVAPPKLTTDERGIQHVTLMLYRSDPDDGKLYRVALSPGEKLNLVPVPRDPNLNDPVR